MRKKMTIKEVEAALGHEVELVTEPTGRMLKKIEPGNTFKVGELEFFVFEQGENYSKVLLRDFWKTTRFDGNCNNFAASEIIQDLNTDFYNTLSKAVGKENIILHTVDLTSDDGRKEYGECKTFVSLLTCDMYRQHVDIIDKYRITSDCWWLVTPYSTKSNGYEISVRCVDNNGSLFNINCHYNFGVRPFCILKSNIFVSE